MKSLECFPWQKKGKTSWKQGGLTNTMCNLLQMSFWLAGQKTYHWPRLHLRRLFFLMWQLSNLFLSLVWFGLLLQLLLFWTNFYPWVHLVCWNSWCLSPQKLRLMDVWWLDSWRACQECSVHLQIVSVPASVWHEGVPWLNRQVD